LKSPLDKWALVRWCSISLLLGQPFCRQELRSTGEAQVLASIFSSSSSGSSLHCWAVTLTRRHMATLSGANAGSTPSLQGRTDDHSGLFVLVPRPGAQAGFFVLPSFQMVRKNPFGPPLLQGIPGLPSLQVSNKSARLVWGTTRHSRRGAAEFPHPDDTGL